jgi:hypothetical protein
VPRSPGKTRRSACLVASWFCRRGPRPNGMICLVWRPGRRGCCERMGRAVRGSRRSGLGLAERGAVGWADAVFGVDGGDGPRVWRPGERGEVGGDFGEHVLQPRRGDHPDRADGFVGEVGEGVRDGRSALPRRPLLLLDDLATKADALAADVDARPSDQPACLALGLPTERATQRAIDPLRGWRALDHEPSVFPFEATHMRHGRCWLRPRRCRGRQPSRRPAEHLPYDQRGSLAGWQCVQRGEERQRDRSRRMAASAGASGASSGDGTSSTWVTWSRSVSG